jgi:hypothetical protein
MDASNSEMSIDESMIFSVALDFVVNYGKERRQSGAKEIEK